MPSQLPKSSRNKTTLKQDKNVKKKDGFTNLHHSDGNENTKKTPNNTSKGNINELDKSKNEEEKQQTRPHTIHLKKSIFSNDDSGSTSMSSQILKSSTRKQNSNTTFTK